MRTKLWGRVAAATLMIGLFALPVISTGQNAEPQGEIDELLRQRRDTFRRLVEIVTEQYLVGASSFDSVVRAKEGLIDAELELAQTPQEHLALLQQQVKMFESLSETTQARHARGQVSESERLAVRAALLDAKITLARYRSGDKPSN